jgi:preprotein translocase subunit SecF
MSKNKNRRLDRNDRNIEEKSNYHKKSGNSFLNSIKRVYENDYKKLFLIPILILLLSFAQIGYQYYTTGDFVKKGVSLKGGVTLSIPSENISVDDLRNYLLLEYPNNDVEVRSISSSGQQVGIIVEMDINVEDNEFIDTFLDKISLQTNIDKNDINLEGMGSSLSDTFFKGMILAIFFAFLAMSLVVFLYFRTFVPSFAVVWCAFSNMIVTLAVINIIDIKLSTAGIAAFLMMIGYSVDTDLLLSIWMLKRKEGSLIERMYRAFSTGMTMTITTLTAVTIALIVTDSEVIRQIMIILFIGLLIDIINTWIQNVGILRLYLEKKVRK